MDFSVPTSHGNYRYAFLVMVRRKGTLRLLTHGFKPGESLNNTNSLGQLFLAVDAMPVRRRRLRTLKVFLEKLLVLSAFS